MVLFVTALSDARSERALSAPIKFDAKTESVGALESAWNPCLPSVRPESPNGVFGQNSYGSLRHASSVACPTRHPSGNGSQGRL
jgi:hypothetical protein